MRKTYETPTSLAVVLSSYQMMAESLRIVTPSSDDEIIDDPDDILVKEDKTTNIWDTEW